MVTETTIRLQGYLAKSGHVINQIYFNAKLRIFICFIVSVLTVVTTVYLEILTLITISYLSAMISPYIDAISIHTMPIILLLFTSNDIPMSYIY